MPLTHLGQLQPTMKQQVALQKALLALVREDEELRRKPEKQPALTRGLGGEVKPYAGPTPTLGGGEPPLAAEGAPTARAPLARALAPTTGAPDVQAEAWARRKEIVEENQAKLDAQADALYQAAQGLSKKDQDYILSKVVTKGKPSALAGALGAEPGTISPAAIRTDPLMKTMIDKHYIRLDENGQTYSWMLPEEEKKFVEMMQDPQSGELKKVYADGSIESTGMFGSLEPEVEPPKLSEQVSLARLQFDIEKYGQENVETAMKQLGDAPILGGTMRAPGTSNYRKVKQEDVDAYYNALQELSNYMRINKSGPQTVSDVAALYKNNPEAIKTVQAQFGLDPTGTWTPELEQMLYNAFTKGE